MIDPKKLEQLARKMQETLPKGICNLSHNLAKKIHQGLQNQFIHMGLVSREEFDVQTQVLLRTREKLNQLELRINVLETIPKNYVPVVQSASVMKSDDITDDIISVFPVDRTALDSVTGNKSANNICKKL